MKRSRVRTDRVRGRRVGAALSAVAAAVLLAAPAAAQDLDRGRLALEVDNRQAGTEEFRVWRADGSLNAWGRISRPGASARTIELISDGQFKPVQYLVRDGDATPVRGTRSGDRFRVQMTSSEGERWKEFLTRDPVVALDPGVAHQHLLLVQALEANSPLVVILPSEGRRETATLAGTEQTEVALQEGSVTATRYDVRIGGSLHRVWVGTDGRLLRVVDPVSGITASRVPGD